MSPIYKMDGGNGHGNGNGWSAPHDVMIGLALVLTFFLGLAIGFSSGLSSCPFEDIPNLKPKPKAEQKYDDPYPAQGMP